MRLVNVRNFAVIFLIIFATGCELSTERNPVALDDTQSNPTGITDLSKLRFTTADGDELAITDLFDTDYLVLVITRGFKGSICLFCSTQTSKWARRYNELAAHNADLAVVFPTLDPAGSVRVDELEKAILGGSIPNDDIPYPILVDFDLASTKELGLRAELAKPATYIINRDGSVVYAYVGRSLADRPTVDAVIAQLERLPKQ